MFSKLKKRERPSGATLLETICAAVVLSIIVIGATGYRYHSTLNARCADEHIAAARLGQLVCASWAGLEGDETYDPVAHLGSELSMEVLGPPKSLPPAFVLLGRYRATIEDVDYRIVLSWNDVSSELRALWIRVEWDWREEDPSDPLKPLRKSFVIITYVPK
ncbi:MAG: hypothetical protein JSW66_00595 [Phycisphaerales bacterium]|nr:MAG: hypothetical protein JSW66_00595 [Phycisphaerales bacterium]